MGSHVYPGMRKTLLTLCLLLAASSTALAAPVLGQSVIYRYDSTHSYGAIVSRVYLDGTADLVILAKYPWSFGFGNSSMYTWPSTYLEGVTEGTSDNRWAVNPDVSVEGPTGATGATGAAGSTGPGALVTATSTPSFALGGSAIQPDSTHDANLIFSLTISLPLSVLAGATGTVHLLCDSSSTPTTEVATLQRGNTGGLLTTDTATLALTYRVPAAHYCKLTTTQDVGSPTFAIVRQKQQTLGN